MLANIVQHMEWHFPSEYSIRDHVRYKPTAVSMINDGGGRIQRYREMLCFQKTVAFGLSAP